MNAQELVNFFRNNSVELYVNDDKIKFKAPIGFTTEELLESLRTNKNEIIALLKAVGESKQLIPRLAEGVEKPLSFAQQRLWFLDQFEPGSAFYNIPIAVHLVGELNEAALRHTLNEIIRRHQVLRTSFVMLDSAPVQIISEQLELIIPLTDLTDLASTDRETQARRLARDEAQTPFNLSTGPLIRAGLIRLDVTDHILLITLHHIVSDGWSMGVLVKEVAALYTAYMQGKPSPLPELPIQYADFAHWQRQWLSGDILQQQLNYWMRQLDGIPTLLALPTDHLRPVMRSSNGERYTFEISTPTAIGLQTLTRQTNTTLFMVLVAAFDVLLWRYSGQNDICIGTPIANRNRSEIESLIGFFVNTLVLRTQINAEQSFNSLLQQVRSVTLDVYNHQDVPFEQLVDVLKPERHTGHSPLFQIMLALHNTPIDDLQLPGLKLRPADIETATAKFDLTLNVVEMESRLNVFLEYSTDLFERMTIKRMAGHFQVLLQAIVADPDAKITELPLLSPEEERQFAIWNNTGMVWPGDATLISLFEAQVALTPDATALRFAEQLLTYAQLDAQANQLAHLLHTHGAMPERSIAVCLERSPDLLIALLAIAKTGGAYLPLDPAYPAERITMILDDAQPLLLLTHSALLAALPSQRPRTLELDTLVTTLSALPTNPPPRCLLADALAYTIYTSGSTGRPKGVQISQRALANFLLALEPIAPLGPADTVLALTSVAFDIAALELYLPLIHGAQVVLAPQQALNDPAQLRGLLDAHRPTLLQATPATWRLLLTDGWMGHAGMTLLCGGEALDRELAQVLERCGERVWNMYGPTETTVWSTVQKVPDGAEGPAVAIGQPIANTTVHVLDAGLRKVPVGVTGELYIGGAGLARGYHQRPELTAERFVPDPFSGTPGGRLYRTGDLARWLPDGNLEYLGRIDYQVKIRGFRIELGEIESALSQHPDVRQAVVIAREDHPGDKRLVAYVVSRTSTELSVSELRSALKTKLPDYMLPAIFVFLDQLPLTPNGKIDRKALPTPDQDRRQLAAGYVAPRTEAEETLANIWKEILKIKRVGIHDNFFDLGGDSLLGVRMVALANKEALHLAPRQIFQHQTLAELAAAVNTATEFQAEQVPVVGPIHLTCDQHWYLYYAAPHRINPERWNIGVFLQMPPGLCDPKQVNILEQIVQAIWKYHDALRARFVYQESTWQQYIISPEEFNPFLRIDLSGLSDAEISVAIETQADQLQASLDITNGPLFRVAAFDLGQHRPGRLLIIAHHLVIDGFSLQILLKDLQECYLQLSQGRPIQLPPKTVSIRQWTELLHQYAQSSSVYRELDYWLNLPWADVLPLPVDDPDGYQSDSVPTQESISISFTSKETTLILRDISTFYQTSPLHILLMVLTETIGHWTGGQAVEITCPILGRDILPQAVNIDLSRTIGFLVLSKVLVLRRAETDNPLDALRTIETQLRQSPHQSCGYHLLSDLRGDAEITRQLKPLRKDELLFNYVGQMQSENADATWVSPAPEYMGDMQDPRQRPYHLLTILGSIFENKLTFKWTYSPRLHRADTITGLAQFFKETVLTFIKYYQDDVENKDV